jgi:uncharacterized membrane protein
MPRAETIELDMSVDTALKYIVSMGVVSPAELVQQGAPMSKMTPAGQHSIKSENTDETSRSGTEN